MFFSLVNYSFSFRQLQLNEMLIRKRKHRMVQKMTVHSSILTFGMFNTLVFQFWHIHTHTPTQWTHMQRAFKHLSILCRSKYTQTAITKTTTFRHHWTNVNLVRNCDERRVEEEEKNTQLIRETVNLKAVRAEYTKGTSRLRAHQSNTQNIQTTLGEIEWESERVIYTQKSSSSSSSSSKK